MLLTDQRIAVQQIPFFARIVALLAPVFSDISAVCLAGLEAEFYKLLVSRSSPIGFPDLEMHGIGTHSDRY